MKPSAPGEIFRIAWWNVSEKYRLPSGPSASAPPGGGLSAPASLSAVVSESSAVVAAMPSAFMPLSGALPATVLIVCASSLAMRRIRLFFSSLTSRVRRAGRLTRPVAGFLLDVADDAFELPLRRHAPHAMVVPVHDDSRAVLREDHLHRLIEPRAFAAVALTVAALHARPCPGADLAGCEDVLGRRCSTRIRAA